MSKLLGTVACVGVLLAMSAHAHAQSCMYQSTTINTCDQLPAPVYLSGSTALRPLYKTLGKALITAGAPATVVFLTAGQGSCTGILAQKAGTQIAASTTATWINDQGAECTCTVATATDVTIGVADVYPDTCGVTAADLSAKSLADFHGPVNAMTFVTTKDSTQKAISAEQAYLAFGFGAMYSVAPWLDPAFFWIRPDVSGTLRMLAQYTLHDFTKWLGLRANMGVGMGCPDPSASGCASNGSGDVFKAIVQGNSSPTDREKYLGILGFDFLLAQANATDVKILAFRGYKQRYAYYPDSTPTATDKRNVRDGHYLPWGPAHLTTAVDGTGQPTNAGAKALVNRLRDAQSVDSASANADLTSLITNAHLVPVCAMKVDRSSDGGDLTSYTPPAACDCFFELSVGASAKPGCANTAAALGECASSPCASGTCRRGVCETR
jgi:hypothetical protein